MKKQLAFALLSAALLAPSFAQTSTGFSRSSKSSATSTSRATATPRATVAPKRDYSSTTSYATKKTEPSKPSYSYSGTTSTAKQTPPPQPAYRYSGASTPPKPSAPSFASPYTQAVVPVAPKPKAVESSRYAAQPTPTLTPAAIAPAKSGFSVESKSSTGKKVATVAGASALGGALYAATANQNAVATYEAAQKEAAAAKTRTATKPDTGPSMAKTTVEAPPQTTYPSGTAYQSKAQPQVIVVQEAPRYRRDAADEAYAYQRGRESAQQDQAASTWSTPRAPMPGTVYAPSATSPTMPAVVRNTKTDSSGSGVALFVGLLLVIALGVGLYFWWTASARNRATQPSRPAAPKSNYTL